ncbi:hypothetical protein [Paludibacter jiangxiensis]|uniref:LTXXQ motif family protein n=1 Tax=Paludibacter jiangxiensis TaxID=681398 RepID=A0A171A7G9_9BACT|nr:hypothetical protein [Paludibacter jiangxiensis]GAT63361.1 hypothetical protein PJIAN_3687 [Paludibacter jiangxiensis]
MKNLLLLCTFILVSFAIAGQQTQRQQLTPGERAKAYTEWMQKTLQLSPDQTVRINPINQRYASMLEEAKTSDDGKIQKLKKIKNIQKQRDAEFSSILTKEQMDLYLQKEKEFISSLRK